LLSLRGGRFPRRGNPQYDGHDLSGKSCRLGDHYLVPAELHS
jgi:hypothetical protein